MSRTHGSCCSSAAWPSLARTACSFLVPLLRCMCPLSTSCTLPDSSRLGICPRRSPGIPFCPRRASRPRNRRKQQSPQSHFGRCRRCTARKPRGWSPPGTHPGTLGSSSSRNRTRPSRPDKVRTPSSHAPPCTSQGRKACTLSAFPPPGTSRRRKSCTPPPQTSSRRCTCPGRSPCSSSPRSMIRSGTFLRRSACTPPARRRSGTSRHRRSCIPPRPPQRQICPRRRLHTTSCRY